MSARLVSLCDVAVGAVTPNARGSLERVRAVFYVPTLERVLGRGYLQREALFPLWAQQPDMPLQIEGLEGGFLIVQVGGAVAVDRDTLICDDVTFDRWPMPESVVRPRTVWERRVADQFDPDDDVRIEYPRGFLLYAGRLGNLKVSFPELDPDEALLRGDPDG